jgi:hypothetical protein
VHGRRRRRLTYRRRHAREESIGLFAQSAPHALRARTPAVRHGEVLVADSGRVEGGRNLGTSEAVPFWIVVPASHAPRAGRHR